MIPPLPRGHSLAGALRLVALGASARDAAPAFPGDALDALEAAGALALTAPSTGRPAPAPAEEWALVRAAARADGSVSRILDGHLNAVERLSVLAPEPLRTGELTATAAGRRRLGVWGADPAPGQGEPAVLVEGDDGPALRGVKVFCSGAGGLDRALTAVGTLVRARRDLDVFLLQHRLDPLVARAGHAALEARR